MPRAGDGDADAGWDPDVANGGVLVPGRRPATRLAAGGSFTAVDGQSTQGIALFELPVLSPDPGGLDFGEQDVDDGETATQDSTITNPGAATITFSASPSAARTRASSCG